jgi:PPOX class probable F420-dependent enzyme
MELHDALAFARTRDQGVLVTTKRDGRPQLSNITYSLGDDGVVRISVTASRAKTANARRDPRVSLYVTRDDFYAYAVIEGRAEVTPVATDPRDETVEELIEYYRTAAGEHPDWDEYRRVMVADGRLVLRIHPERAYGMLPTPTG